MDCDCGDWRLVKSRFGSAVRMVGLGQTSPNSHHSQSARASAATDQSRPSRSTPGNVRFLQKQSMQTSEAGIRKYELTMVISTGAKRTGKWIAEAYPINRTSKTTLGSGGEWCRDISQRQNATFAEAYEPPDFRNFGISQEQNFALEKQFGKKAIEFRHPRFSGEWSEVRLRNKAGDFRSHQPILE